MRICLSFCIGRGRVGIGLFLPAFAEQKYTAGPNHLTEHLLGDVNVLAELPRLRTNTRSAQDILDAAADVSVLKLKTVLFVRRTMFFGARDIEKWHSYTFQRASPPLYPPGLSRDAQLVTGFWRGWSWWSTLAIQNGPGASQGLLVGDLVREGDAWKIRMANYNVAGDISLTPSANSTAGTD